MTIAQKPSLQLQLDEIEMIASASDKELVCSFYHRRDRRSERTVERARDIVHRVNVHDKLLDVLLDIKRLAEKSGDHEADPFALLDLIAYKTRAAINNAIKQ
jgi:precorrin-3B methylase